MIERLISETGNAGQGSGIVSSNDMVIMSALRDAYVSAAMQLPKDIVIGKVQGSTFATLGNFSAIIGKAKSRKTFCLSAIVASAQSSHEICGFGITMPKSRPNILYFDTEQSTFHIVKVKQRVNCMAGIPADNDVQNLEVYGLRKYTPDERIKMIDAAIRMSPDVSLVVIDGLRDLIYDINNPSESTTVISRLMKWTEEYNIHICTVLHQNKGDENARGHIGTELVNKAETIIQVEKDKMDKDVSVVSSVYVRDKDFEPFAFHANEEGIPVLTDLPSSPMSGNGNFKSIFDPRTSIPTATHNNVLCMVFKNDNSYGWADLKEVLRTSYADCGFTLGSAKLMSTIRYLKESGIIVQLEGKKYSLASDYHQRLLTLAAD